MHITYDPVKRQKTLEERRLDFLDAARVFAGPTVTIIDDRFDYGEQRQICFGYLNGRMVVVGFVQRGNTRHVFSMRKANVKEQQRYAPTLH